MIGNDRGNSASSILRTSRKGPLAGRFASFAETKPVRSHRQELTSLIHVIELMLPPLGARVGLLSYAWAALSLIFLTAFSARCQSGEFPVSGGLTGDQDYAGVSLRTNGGWVVWQDNTIDGNRTWGIAARKLSADLTATGSIFRVNHVTTGSQEKPQAVSLPGGRVLFTWESRNGPNAGVYTRILGSDGQFLTGDVLVNPITVTGSEKQEAVWSGFFRNRWKQRKFKFKNKLIHYREGTGHAALAPLPDGATVVAYHSVRRTETNTWGLIRDIRIKGIKSSTNDLFRPIRRFGSTMQDIFFQRIDANGVKMGGEIMVNQYSAFNQRNPAITLTPDGGFVIVWISETPRTSDPLGNFRVEIFGRRFNAQGEPVGNEFTLASDDDVVRSNPAVAALSDGRLVVYWSERRIETPDGWDVKGQVFDTGGVAMGPAFRLNAHIDGNQFAPRVAAEGDDHLVVWTSTGQDGSKEGVFGRLVTAGVVSGSELGLNITTISRQIHPFVAAGGDGRFLGVWTSYAGETGADLLGRVIIP